QKKAELEKQKTALNEAVKTKDKIAKPVAIIRDGLNSMRRSFQEQGVFSAFEQNLNKMYGAIERIDDLLYTFENNKNITFGLYLNTDEMVEFQPKKT
nr:hypothetical protein [Candidatus Cloacimonadota bacterium]